MNTQCVAFTNDGIRCSRTGRPAYDIRMCKTHWDYYSGLVEERGVRHAMTIINQHNANLAQRREDRIERQHRREFAALGAMDDLNAEIAQEALERRLQQLRDDIERFEREQPIQQRRPRRQIGDLEKFVKDKQNVHTTAAVKQTMDILEKILKIAVPEEYKWNMETCSKTPGEIVAECGLTIDASRTMMDKYTLDNDVYEMGKGIYGRVLDCVWQYIKNSKEKDDLVKILKSELEDNIGMCEQGNLSRVANVLAGYMDGVGNQESHAEILGREFPKLWDIDDEDERVEAGNELLDKIGVKENKVREEWIASLY